jgi:hypothetical protein
MQSNKVGSASTPNNFVLRELDYFLADPLNALAAAQGCGEVELKDRIDAFVKIVFAAGNESYLKQFTKWAGKKKFHSPEDAKYFLSLIQKIN